MNKNKNSVRIIPLGGLERIGVNITAIEYNDEIIVIDCGLGFPEDAILVSQSLTHSLIFGCTVSLMLCMGFLQLR